MVEVYLVMVNTVNNTEQYTFSLYYVPLKIRSWCLCFRRKLSGMFLAMDYNVDIWITKYGRL